MRTGIEPLTARSPLRMRFWLSLWGLIWAGLGTALFAVAGRRGWATACGVLFLVAAQHGDGSAQSAIHGRWPRIGLDGRWPGHSRATAVPDRQRRYGPRRGRPHPPPSKDLSSRSRCSLRRRRWSGPDECGGVQSGGSGCARAADHGGGRRLRRRGGRLAGQARPSSVLPVRLRQWPGSGLRSGSCRPRKWSTRLWRMGRLPCDAGTGVDSEAYEGAAPITRASTRNYVGRRFMKNDRLDHAGYLGAFATRAHSKGANAHYRRRREAGDRHTQSSVTPVQPHGRPAPPLPPDESTAATPSPSPPLRVGEVTSS